jgi:hypothetical protein
MLAPPDSIAHAAGTMQIAPLAVVGLGIFELLILLPALGFFFIPWLIALVDCLKSDFQESNQKVIWIVVLLLVPFLGWILYFIIGRGQKKPTR